MGFFKISLLSIVRNIFNWLCLKYSFLKITLISLFYNDLADVYYVGDTFMEPMFWIVDHFAKILGPVCVAAVVLLSSSIILIAYVIGLPFYMKQHICILTLALGIGHWLLINFVFYYYKAYTTDPGFPPQGAMIAEAVTICKRCIAPKPPRTHHCVVCNRCILKMDHHCPWLNNCIGHFNHRYFFMFGLYTWVGIVFVIIFGIPVAYEHFFLAEKPSSISPHVVTIVESIAAVIPFKNPYTTQSTNSTSDGVKWPESTYHSCVVYAAFLCVAVLLIVGGLLMYHGRLIYKGETTIEGHINKAETKRLLEQRLIYKNPYDLGPMRNWMLFLCIGYSNRSWFDLLVPFSEAPMGDGMQWNFLHKIKWQDNRNSKSGFVKLA